MRSGLAAFATCTDFPWTAGLSRFAFFTPRPLLPAFTTLALRSCWTCGAGLSWCSRLSALALGSGLAAFAALALWPCWSHGARVSRRSRLAALTLRPRLAAFAALALWPCWSRGAGVSRRSWLAALTLRPRLAAFPLRTRRSVLAVEAVPAGLAVDAICATSVAHRDNGAINLSETFGHGRSQLGDRRASFGRDQLAIALPLPIGIGERFAEGLAEGLSQNAVLLWRRRRGCFAVPV